MTTVEKDEMNLRLPLVVILGSTGSGKTKLSLELAKKFGGEIIGADSMQLYKALDIITAKATKEEQQQAPHHMIDILEPNEVFTVLDYRNRTVKLIDNLLAKNKLPIVVGGTNYYIESVLWKILVDNEGTRRQFEPGLSDNGEHSLSSEELHQRLQLLDPEMAERIHPNNKRKILSTGDINPPLLFHLPEFPKDPTRDHFCAFHLLMTSLTESAQEKYDDLKIFTRVTSHNDCREKNVRSLEVLRLNGRKHSEILKEQRESFGGSSQGGGLRYKNSLIFWLQCDQKILDERLNSRVDSMIEQGLLDELRNFHKSYNLCRNENEKEPDYTKGIFQSIGFKEFHKYLYSNTDDELEKERLLQEGIDELKMVTRRYARKQVKWVKNRFLGRKDRDVPPVYGLNTEDVSKWDENVLKPASEILEAYLSSKPFPYERLSPVDVASCPNSQDTSYKCEICDRIFIGEYQWSIHLKSSRHKKRVHKKNSEHSVDTKRIKTN